MNAKARRAAGLVRGTGDMIAVPDVMKLFEGPGADRVALVVALALAVIVAVAGGAHAWRASRPHAERTERAGDQAATPPVETRPAETPAARPTTIDAGTNAPSRALPPPPLPPIPPRDDERRSPGG